jgi:hypothetical protein
VAAAGAGWASTVTAQGLLVAEHPGHDAQTGRDIAVVAPADDEPVLDAWVWTDGQAQLAPLGRYLLHNAKLRDQIRRYERDTKRLPELSERLGAEVAGLFDALRGEEPPLALAERLDRMRRDEIDLVKHRTELLELRHSADVCRYNMVHAVPAQFGAAPPQGLFAEDLAAADWFEQRLTDDIAHLDVLRQRADLGSLVERYDSERLVRAQQSLRHHQERLALLQTAVIGAVVMALTAVQAFQYRVPMPGPVQPAVIACLTSLALLMSSAAVRYYAHSRSALDYLLPLATACLGGSIAWLAVATGGYLVASSVPPAGTAAAALVGGAGGALLGHRLGRRSNPDSRGA